MIYRISCKDFPLLQGPVKTYEFKPIFFDQMIAYSQIRDKSIDQHSLKSISLELKEIALNYSDAVELPSINPIVEDISVEESLLDFSTSRELLYP